MARELRFGVFADAVVRAGDGGGGVGEGGFLFERGGVYGGGGGAALCVCFLSFPFTCCSPCCEWVLMDRG